MEAQDFEAQDFEAQDFEAQDFEAQDFRECQKVDAFAFRIDDFGLSD
jgi:hypothetical protein